MLAYATLLAIIVANCSGYAEYELFNGFDVTASTLENTHNPIDTTYATSIKTGISKSKMKQIRQLTSTTQTNKFASPKNKTQFECREEESPKNIGPYEVPTQRDLVVLTKHILLKSYYNYNQESLQLLKDIKEATKAALALKTKCNFNKKLYTQCVKNVSKQSERYAKDTLLNLAAQKHDVLALTEDQICTLADMKTDPLQFIKLLAQEKTSLHFVLPGFLILLHSCNVHCSRLTTNSHKRKPLRHLTDQDLVISHFLTKKNYIQLINDSKHKV